MKNFEKQFDIRNTVEYVKKRMKWIAVIGVVCFGIVFATLYFGERERLGSTDTYTCSEMIVVIPEDHSGYTGRTCLEILISRAAIEPVAEELGLHHGYNGVFGLMDWKWGSNYFAYKVSLTSNTKEIDGYPLEVILGKIIENERTKRGLSVNDVCNGICSAAVCSKLESGEYAGGIHILRALCQRLGINSDRCGTYLPQAE